MRLTAGLRVDPLWELTMLPRLPAVWSRKEQRWQRTGRENELKREGARGREFEERNPLRNAEYTNADDRLFQNTPGLVQLFVRSTRLGYVAANQLDRQNYCCRSNYRACKFHAMRRAVSILTAQSLTRSSKARQILHKPPFRYCSLRCVLHRKFNRHDEILLDNLH